MKYFRLISPLLNPNSHSQTLGFLRSKPLFSSTFSTSSSNLYQLPEFRIPINRSWNHTRYACESTTTSIATEQEPKKLITPSKRVLEIVDEIVVLNQIEVTDLFELVAKKLDIKENEIPMMFVMMPGMGMGFGGKSSGKGGSGGGGEGAKGGEKKEEKTAFDVKLEGFDAVAKIKIIKEVRTFTDLGLKEAKELVEKAPIVLKKGVIKEEAEKIIEKMKAIGAKVSME
ncbi:50S ribosomal protein L7/L12 protein [Thalictrum thalictroides]|uniref:50S ribosomal protein L7/L12 protein n=1 Tax=Thalictrum thalictroides TaxID=46969 RepID=A0A7J6WAS5_THATH|nr:50S ribosomal protein L7/L12 protein [Thalictrum thalictroides]